jgi:hypothetical protein
MPGSGQPNRKGPLLALLREKPHTMQQILHALGNDTDEQAWRSAVCNLVKSKHIVNLCTRGRDGLYVAATDSAREAATPPKPPRREVVRRGPLRPPALPQQTRAGLDLMQAWRGLPAEAV